MVYTNGYKDEVYAIRMFTTPILFPRGQCIIHHFRKTQITKKHLKITKTNQTIQKFDVHLRLIVAFYPVQSEMSYNFFWRKEKKI